jgi:hypothetical protein
MRARLSGARVVVVVHVLRNAVSAEDEQFRAFTEGRPLPSDPRVDRSMQIIRAATARGCRIRRVHVIDRP